MTLGGWDSDISLDRFNLETYMPSVTLGGWDLDFSLDRFNLEKYMHSVTLGSWDSDSVCILQIIVVFLTLLIHL